MMATTITLTPKRPSASPAGPARAGDRNFTVSVIVAIATFPAVSVARATIVFDPSRRVRVADHDAVPDTRIHVVQPKLSPTISIAMSSEAFPFTVTVAYGRTDALSGNVIATVGAAISKRGIAETS